MSNDAYLDAVAIYLQAVIHDDRNLYGVNDPEADLLTMQPEGWFRTALRVQTSTCALPAAEAQTKYALSIFQHLTMVGLLAMRDGVLSFDFSDPSEVTSLFARGRVCRKRMREHLFGEKSQLLQQRLVEGNQGVSGDLIQLTQLGIKTLLGKHGEKISVQDLRRRVRKSTLFDFEEPQVNKEALLLGCNQKCG